MNEKQFKSGSVRHWALIAIMCSLALGYIGFVFAQSAVTYDPCAVYPHTSVNIPVATPTQKLIAGVLNKQIYICGVHVAQFAGATPGLTLSYGEVAAATPCATATPGATLGIYGSGTAGTTNNIASGTGTLVGPVPAAAGTPVVDVCSLANTASVAGGSVDYVQR